MSDKDRYIISGCNGAGKTTAAGTLLPMSYKCIEFVNADEIARGISPFNPTAVAIEAGKIMLNRIRELLSDNLSFAIETTLAAKSYVNLIEEAQVHGYKVTLVYFWLKSTQLACRRVAKRVSLGGHDIPRQDIIRRYYRGIDNFFNLYKGIVDSWMLVDNSVSPRELIAYGGRDKEEVILNEIKFIMVKQNVGRRIR